MRSLLKRAKYSVNRVLQFLFYRKYKIKALQEELKLWKTNFRQPGHYYSPFPDTAQMIRNKERLFNRNPETVFQGLALNENEQFRLLEKLSKHYQPHIFPEEKEEGSRYYFNNQYFCYSDAVFLYCIIREINPKKIIEIGSGFSSAAMLDINEKYYNNSIELTFIEPYPAERLDTLVKEADTCSIISNFVQEVPLGLFLDLEEDDILFIDSSHVSKTGSDVNHLLFNVLPVLKKGVLIHFHDIFFPFEYPSEWVVDQQRGWNEAYLVRSFLQFNDTFSIALFTSFLENKFRNWFEAHMPLCLTPHEKWPATDGGYRYLDTAGQSLYLRKVK